jgi:hypothetical protein
VIGHTSVIHRGRRTQIWQTRVATDEAKLVALVVQTQMTSERAQGQIRASKRKLMKENESNFAFISFHFFLQIGTFQRVADDSNKKNFFAVHTFLRRTVEV